MGVTLLLVLLVVAIIALHWIWVLITSRGDPPNLPGFLPVIGHSYKLLTDSEGVFDCIKEVAQFGYKNNGVAKLWLGVKSSYVIVDPEIAALICKTCVEKTALSYKLTRPIMGHGLLTASASIWKNHRKLLNQAFSVPMLDKYIIVFNEQARRLIKEISEKVGGTSFDQLVYSKKCSMEAICMNAMGVDISEECYRNKLYIKSIEQTVMMIYQRFCKVWLHSDYIFNLSNFKKKQDHYIKILHEVSESALQRSKEKLLQDSRLAQTNNLSGTKCKTYIDILLESKNFSTQAIHDEVVTILMGGTDTTATVLSYVLTMIGSLPDIQDEIVAEFQNELKNCDEDITRNDLIRLKYLEAVIKETLRFQTLSPLLVRRIDTEIKTKRYSLKAGSDCILVTDALHRHPSWGPDVNEFKPERWLDPTTHPESSNAFAAFGLGRRNCIGKTYAMASLKITLIYLLRSYRISADYTKMKRQLGLLCGPVSGHEISVEYR